MGQCYFLTSATEVKENKFAIIKNFNNQFFLFWKFMQMSIENRELFYRVKRPLSKYSLWIN